MKIAIMQPYFFPYIGYWQLIHSVDKFVIYDDVNYKKRGWINRNNILINGEMKRINLQIKGASQNKLIKDTEILNDKRYNQKLLELIEKCYRKATWFSSAYPILSEIINQEEKNLSTWLEYSIKRICEYLRIDTEIILSSSIAKNNELRGSTKILEICKVLDADEYHNAIGGQELYCYEDFMVNNIILKFLKPGEIIYQQFTNQFIPNLSIIDVIMFNSIKDIRNMLDQYELI